MNKSNELHWVEYEYNFMISGNFAFKSYESWFKLLISRTNNFGGKVEDVEEANLNEKKRGNNVIVASLENKSVEIIDIKSNGNLTLI